MPLNVLVFEGDPAFAAALRAGLEAKGCAVQIVEDGNAGLMLASQLKPDLILLAIELPRMNGFSVCNKLKKDMVFREVPLVILSSESSEETFEQHRKLRTRAEEYVHKPIAVDSLIRRIETFVDFGDSRDDSYDVSIDVQDDDLSSEGEITVAARPLLRHGSGEILSLIHI